MVVTADAIDDVQRVPRILIVDDVADNRTLLNRRFTRAGFECHEAKTGREAVETALESDFDAVILDIMMPEMDGLAVLSELRRNRSRLELPIIMVTARSDPDTIVDALRREANDYIIKPVIFEVALARVAAQIERKMANERSHAALAALRLANERLEAKTESLTLINAQLSHQTYHDALTQLPNRRWLNERLATVGTTDGTHDVSALLLLDLDGFKEINDGLGHSAGDAFLVQLSADLRASLGASGEIARLGGDEFAVLAPPAASPAEHVALAEMLLDIASRERIIHGNAVKLGASIGIASVGAFDTAVALLQAADIAMYEAKAAGRGAYCVFRPEFDERLRHRRAILADLRGALERGELDLHYQPLVDANSHQVTCYEALLRWQHPVRGQIGPAHFVPIAEESGLIVPIGAWVLSRACQHAATLPPHLRVAVNVSPAQFRRAGFEATVMSAIANAGIRPSQLELEITEALLVEDIESTRNLMTALKGMGVRLSLDDFGTGYSSLGYLRRYPFDKLKIDRSFVSELTSRTENEAIVRAICQMAEALAMTVTAEGVETREQAETLLRVGCKELQGYYFGAPRQARAGAGRSAAA